MMFIPFQTPFACSTAFLITWPKQPTCSIFRRKFLRDSSLRSGLFVSFQKVYLLRGIPRDIIAIELSDWQNRWNSPLMKDPHHGDSNDIQEANLI